MSNSWWKDKIYSAKKVDKLCRAKCYFSLESIYIFIILPYVYALNIAVHTWSGASALYLEIPGKIQIIICNVIVPERVNGL